MKLHLPLALFAAIVCVSTPVAQAAKDYSNVSEFLRTKDNPNGIFEHSYDKTTGAVTIILHEGDFSTLDMYRSMAGSGTTKKQLEDDGTIMGAAPLTLGETEKYVSSNYNDNKTDVVNSVSITVNGATKGTGSYDDYSHIANGKYNGEITTDHYGRKVPKPAHGTINLKYKTSSSNKLTEAIIKLYKQIVDENLLIRRINICVNDVVSEETIKNEVVVEQLNLFDDYTNYDKEREKELKSLEEEHRVQNVILDIKKKYGKNAILKGMNLIEGSTAIERNNEVGGHKG